MKKLLSLLLSAVMLLSVLAVVIPVAAAEPQATAEAQEEKINYAEGLKWNKSVGGPAVSMTEEGAIMKGIKNSWDSAGCDILPALKTALGDEDHMTVSVAMEIKATLKAGNAGKSIPVHTLIRGTNTLGGVSDAQWGAAYRDTLNGDDPLFAMTGGNVMIASFTNSGLTLSDGEWVTFKTNLSVTRNQLESALISEWVLCVHDIGGIDMLDSIEFRHLTINREENAFADHLGEDPTTDETVLARELTTEVWSPAEILLRSTVDYANPYTATEIDAVFTHTDGTTITLPGFWMAGKTWAVRFSPTKVGDWAYTITCKDASNRGLTATGVVHATEATRTTETAKHGFITTVKDQHYYQHEDGTPFFWLGDTNWQAFTQVSTTVCNYPGCDCGSQFKHIVDNRVEKGFTVYQTYFVPEAGNGEKPLWLDSYHQKPDTGVFNDKVDEMFAYLHEQGQVVALGLGCHSSTLTRMELDDFLRFTRYIVARYACYSVVWITGQEITDLTASATPGYTVFDCYLEAAALVEELDGYKHPNSAHMFPMTTDDERARRLDNSEWHDSWTVQGGHGVVRPKSFYQSYYEANGSGFTKPFIEAEANYEDINCGCFTGYDLNRMSAWAAMLSGSAGFTYGTTGIWANCFSTSGFTGWYGDTSSFSYDPWYVGLDKPGSYEVAYMKQFFTDIGPWYDLIPKFVAGRDATFVGREGCVMSATEDASLLVAYFYDEPTRTGSVTMLDPEKLYDAYWFNPRTGKYILVEKDIRAEDGKYTIPKKADNADWVFLLTALGIPEHYEEDPFVDLNPDYAQVAPTGTAVKPAQVTAVGGITYSGSVKEAQVMTDHTAWLYDGDPNTVWTPSANRSTQTFLFDLGKAQDLTHITITPAAGTIIPRFRVEGSNDGKVWTIITDTSIRRAGNPGAGSEPLQGVYRYVKVLLLNPVSVDLTENQLGTLSYEAMYNPMSWNSYSVTKIADITIYSGGEATPTPDKLVAARAPGDPDEVVTDEQVTTGEKETVTAAVDPAVTTKEPTSEETGCASVMGAAAATATVALAAAVACARKKREDER